MAQQAGQVQKILSSAQGGVFGYLTDWRLIAVIIVSLFTCATGKVSFAVPAASIASFRNSVRPPESLGRDRRALATTKSQDGATCDSVRAR